MARILIIDDEPQFCGLLDGSLREMGHRVECAHTLADGLRRANADACDLVYLDVDLPDGNGLAEINRFRSCPSAPEVIIMTGAGDPDGAELAIRSGAWDYIEKPSSISAMTLPLIRALQYREAMNSQKPVSAMRCEGVVGRSPAMRRCFTLASQAALSDANVLVGGETGTGKEMAALTIHNNSRRAGRSFVVVDCASLSETLVESVLFGHARGAYTGADSAREGLILQADGGTLFLDEIGELPLSVQKSFLRVLQERRFRPLGGDREIASDFRLIAATNRDLDAMVDDGRFRNDLLFRIRSFQIDVPPLRDRLDDLEEMTLFHIDRICRRYRMPVKEIAPEVYEIFTIYPWPGNVRELVNVLDRAVATAGGASTLFPHHLPENLRIYAARAHVGHNNAPQGDAVRKKDPEKMPSWDSFRRTAIDEAEKEYLLALIEKSGKEPKAALALSGLSRSRFYEILKKHRLPFSF